MWVAITPTARADEICMWLEFKYLFWWLARLQHFKPQDKTTTALVVSPPVAEERKDIL